MVSMVIITIISTYNNYGYNSVLVPVVRPAFVYIASRCIRSKTWKKASSIAGRIR